MSFLLIHKSQIIKLHELIRVLRNKPNIKQERTDILARKKK